MLDSTLGLFLGGSGTIFCPEASHTLSSFAVSWDDGFQTVKSGCLWGRSQSYQKTGVKVQRRRGSQGKWTLVL